MQTLGDGQVTVLRLPLWFRVAAAVVLPVGGAALGWYLPALAGWFADLPWVPFQGPARLLDEWDGPWLLAVTTLAGLAGGVLLAAAVIQDTLTVRLGDREVELTRERRTRTYPREQVGSVFVDGTELVLLGTESHELDRDKTENGPDELADAFRRHGWPWADRDPHADAFRRWVPDTPDLPGGVNALLRARAHALEHKHQQADDVRELKQEVARMGYVIRDEKTRQYWRPAAPG